MRILESNLPHGMKMEFLSTQLDIISNTLCLMVIMESLELFMFQFISPRFKDQKSSALTVKQDLEF